MQSRKQNLNSQPTLFFHLWVVANVAKIYTNKKAHMAKIKKCSKNLFGKCHFYKMAVG
jgi:hypothetical protein